MMYPMLYAVKGVSTAPAAVPCYYVFCVHSRLRQTVYYAIGSRASDFIFRSENRIGLLLQSDFAKSDVINSDLRVRSPKSSGFGLKSDDSTHRIIKSKNGIGL